MQYLVIVNVMIKKCLNVVFRHFDQQNKCAINHYLFKYDSITLSWCFQYFIVRKKPCLP